ncbi:MAG: glycosyltransferase [Candidatus Lokiarchaeota archaeon]|nr:glycosyltransferase [Candidatus Lokiarchaeota archaeon]
MEDKISIIVPAYNEEGCIKDFLLTFPKNSYKEIIVVDDGSTDNTYSQAKYNGAKVIKNPHNMGYGAAILEGVKHAEGDIIVTIDADAQNDAKEIKNLVKPILKGKLDAVIGSRNIGWVESPIPAYKRIGEIFICGILRLCYRKKITYSQSGFKAFKKKLIINEKFTETRFGFNTEFLVRLLKRRYKVKEVPITFYNRKYGKSHINIIKDGLRMLWVLFKSMAFQK